MDFRKGRNAAVGGHGFVFLFINLYLFAKLTLICDKTRRIIIKDAFFCHKVGNQTKKSAEQRSNGQRGTAKDPTTRKTPPAPYGYTGVSLSKFWLSKEDSQFSLSQY